MTARARRATTIAAGIAVAIGAVAWWLAATPEDGPAIALRPDDSGTIALGREVYARECASCHGAGLEGQGNWRERTPDGRLPAPPHDETGHTWHHPDAQLFALTKYGPAALVGGDYKSDMPFYEGVLSDAEIIAVLSFIKSTWPPGIRDRHDKINRQARRQDKPGTASTSVPQPSTVCEHARRVTPSYSPAPQQEECRSRGPK